MLYAQRFLSPCQSTHNVSQGQPLACLPQSALRADPVSRPCVPAVSAPLEPPAGLPPTPRLLAVPILLAALPSADFLPAYPLISSGLEL